MAGLPSRCPGNSFSTFSVVSVSPSLGKIFPDAMTVRFGVSVRDCIYDEHNIVAVIVGATRCRFHAATGRDAGQEDLSHTVLAQVVIQRCANECPQSVFAYQVILRLLLQFRNKLGPIRRKRNL